MKDFFKEFKEEAKGPFFLLLIAMIIVGIVLTIFKS